LGVTAINTPPGPPLESNNVKLPGFNNLTLKQIDREYGTCHAKDAQKKQDLKDCYQNVRDNFDRCLNGEPRVKLKPWNPA
jgi:hypothetical protein